MPLIELTKEIVGAVHAAHDVRTHWAMDSLHLCDQGAVATDGKCMVWHKVPEWAGLGLDVTVPREHARKWLKLAAATVIDTDTLPKAEGFFPPWEEGLKSQTSRSGVEHEWRREDLLKVANTVGAWGDGARFFPCHDGSALRVVCRVPAEGELELKTAGFLHSGGQDPVGLNPHKIAQVLRAFPKGARIKVTWRSGGQAVSLEHGPLTALVMPIQLSGVA